MISRYLLNAPVLTDYGDWRYEGPLSLEAARGFAGAGARSAIGHSATAEFLSQRLGIQVRAQRRAIRMQPGDRALVLRLLERQPEGAVLSAEHLAVAAHEFGLLTRLA